MYAKFVGNVRNILRFFFVSLYITTIHTTMRKLLIVFRLFDPTYSRNGQHGNKESLFVTLREDNVLSYSLIGGWQDSGTPFAISNLQLKESLPLNPKPFRSTLSLKVRVANILATGVGSHHIASYEILNKIK